MERQPTTVEALTRAEIRRKAAAFDAMDRELTERLAAMYGKPSIASPAFSEPEKAAYSRAKQLLNGSGDRLLPDRRGGHSESEIRLERDAVRLVVAALQREDVALAAIETAERVEALSPEWRGLCRKWILAAAAFYKLEQRAQEFIDAAGEARFLLPLTHLVGTGAEIDVRGETFRTLAKAAIAEGIVRADELERK